MDPLSIASTAVGLSATCFQVASAIYRYVKEVRDVDNTVALFGQDMNTLSKALDSVHNALNKHQSSLSTNLGDEVNLFDSFGAW
jgi:DNA anti-recombination protein RmuC